MNIARFVGATVAALAVQLLLNMFVFPLIFPGGVASKFANTRPTPLVALRLAAFLATAVLLTALCAVPRGAGSSVAAAGIGAMAGLPAALPSTWREVRRMDSGSSLFGAGPLLPEAREPRRGNP